MNPSLSIFFQGHFSNSRLLFLTGSRRLAAWESELLTVPEWNKHDSSSGRNSFLLWDPSAVLRIPSTVMLGLLQGARNIEMMQSMSNQYSILKALWDYTNLRSFTFLYMIRHIVFPMLFLCFFFRGIGIHRKAT